LGFSGISLSLNTYEPGSALASSIVLRNPSLAGEKRKSISTPLKWGSF